MAEGKHLSDQHRGVRQIIPSGCFECLFGQDHTLAVVDLSDLAKGLKRQVGALGFWRQVMGLNGFRIRY